MTANVKQHKLTLAINDNDSNIDRIHPIATIH
jgi:hypothetical protein